MSEPAAIRATFSDFKLIKGRRCAQLVFEVPIEEADAAVRTIGGMPQPATERWCGIALLDIAKPTQEPAKEKRPFRELPIAQRAALLCERAAFQTFLREILGYKCEDADQAASVLRRYCDIDSRSALATDHAGAATFIELERQFEIWLREPV